MNFCTVYAGQDLLDIEDGGYKMRLKERIRRFMQGRYGIVDQYSEFLFIVAIPMYIIGNIISIRVVSALLMGVALFLVFYVDYRIMSRNCTKRYRENEQYLMFAGIFRKRWQKFCSRIKDRRENRIYKCPSCKQRIRVPRGKGKIAITCPQCRTEFIRKS